MSLIGPIVFLACEVRAAMAGAKTTVRVPAETTELEWKPGMPKIKRTSAGAARKGDIFWVAEEQVEYTGVRDQTKFETLYRADDPSGFPPCRYPGLQKKVRVIGAEAMRKSQARLVLEVEAVRTEGLLDIAWDDALAEGIIAHGDGFMPLETPTLFGRGPQLAMRNLYGAKYGRVPECGNPRVAVIRFTVFRGSVNAFYEARNAVRA